MFFSSKKANHLPPHPTLPQPPTMSSSISTILIIGATSGIGEAFAHRFHAMGKKVIATGRRQSRLDSLKKTLGPERLETYTMDNADLVSLPGHVDAIMKQFPDIDTVWVNSGIQYSSDFKDPPSSPGSSSSSSDQKIIEEVVVNVTAPTILGRHFIPHLLKSGSGAANFMITSSGLGFVPFGMFPVYCATKSFTHSFLVALRQQLKDTNVNVWELVAPYVGETGLNAEMQADPPAVMKNLKPMPMGEFVEEVVGVLEGSEAGEIKEIAPGSAKGRVDAWRGSIGAILENMKVGG